MTWAGLPGCCSHLRGHALPIRAWRKRPDPPQTALSQGPGDPQRSASFSLKVPIKCGSGACRPVLAKDTRLGPWEAGSPGPSLSSVLSTQACSGPQHPRLRTHTTVLTFLGTKPRFNVLNGVSQAPPGTPIQRDRQRGPWKSPAHKQVSWVRCPHSSSCVTLGTSFPVPYQQQQHSHLCWGTTVRVSEGHKWRLLPGWHETWVRHQH